MTSPTEDLRLPTLKRLGSRGCSGTSSQDVGKSISESEYQSYQLSGIKVGLVYEDAAMDWTSPAAGKGKAMIAIPILKKIGFPAGRPVYAAVDEQLPSSAYAATYASIATFAQALVRPIAIYGPRPFLLYCEQNHGVEWHWEVASASWNTGPEPTSKRLQQLIIGPADIAGNAVDWDEAMADDWGQVPAPAPVDPPSPWVPPPTTEGKVTHHQIKLPVPASGNADGTISVASYPTVTGVWIDGGSGPNDTGYVSAQQAGAGTSVSVRSATPGTTLTVVVATNP